MSKNIFVFENDKHDPVDYNIIFLYDTRTMSQYIKYIRIKRHYIQFFIFYYFIFFEKDKHDPVDYNIIPLYMILGSCHKYIIY